MISACGPADFGIMRTPRGKTRRAQLEDPATEWALRFTPAGASDCASGLLIAGLHVRVTFCG